jgi:hypothetical protein
MSNKPFFGMPPGLIKSGKRQRRWDACLLFISIASIAIGLAFIFAIAEKLAAVAAL